MKKLTIAVLSLLAHPTFAQFKEIIIGTDGQPIYGQQLTLPNPITYFDIDTLKQQLVIVSTPPRTGDKEELTFVDLKNQKLTWSIKPDTRTYGVKMAQQGITRYDGRRTDYLSKANGMTTFSKKGQLAGIDPHFNTVIDQTGNVFNPENGQRIANAGTQHRYGVNEAKHIDNNTYVIAADGLFGVNTKTGKSWGYPSKTGWDYHKGQRFEVANSSLVFVSTLALGAIGGVAAAHATGQLGNGTAISNANSNILVDGNLAYFASLENLVAVDINTGIKKFETPLNGAKTSSSILSANGDDIFLINQGYVPTGQNTFMLCGHPFFACYDKHTGKPIYMDSLGTKGVIASWQLIGQTFFANYNDQYIVAINTTTGERIFTKNLKKTGLSPIATFIDPRTTYVEQKGGTYKLLAEAYPGKFFVKDKGNFIYSFDNGATTAERFMLPVWQTVQHKGKTLMLSDKALVILKDGKNSAILNLDNAIIAGNKAIGINRNSITIADLNAVAN
ncbi:hypothetical protein [Polluticoccus soli]|uniref:hypothetical protein n=1 Tax=Polluticoccus soli TaxID=3034150 RepID=UPI0023E2319B|nr:hypothetical protein [Flavipsychrobacter sp. JY13-12]